jgi:hypothetical protein
MNEWGFMTLFLAISQVILREARQKQENRIAAHLDKGF